MDVFCLLYGSGPVNILKIKLLFKLYVECFRKILKHTCYGGMCKIIALFSAGMPKDVNAIDLSTVKLCFQVFLKDERKNFRIVTPVTSQPIYDKSRLFKIRYVN